MSIINNIIMKTAVLIPCYNEELTINKVVSDFHKALPEAEIYVYDNNSTDNTYFEAEKAGAIVRREPRQGKGNVIRQMLRDIDADCYLMVDGDDTYPAEYAVELCKGVEDGYDMVIGDRLSSTYFTENKRMFHNEGNRLVRFLINKLFDSHIQDIMTGYRAMSRQFAKNLPVISKGFEIETEMTIHALDKNFLIKATAIEYRDRKGDSVSKLNTFSDGIKVIKTILRLFRDYRPLAFFSLASLIMTILSLILFIPVFNEYLETGLVPRYPTLIVSGFIFITAILTFFCGVILEVISQKHRQLYEMLLNIPK